MNKQAFSMFAAFILSAFTAFGEQSIDTYSFKMSLKVPRIYDNSQSLGYRKYQTQVLKGQLNLIYGDDGKVTVQVTDLKNTTHKINGKSITYKCYEWPYENVKAQTVAVGSNKTKKFAQGGSTFQFVADPSYNIGGVEEDNTLMLELSGIGPIKGGKLKQIKGYVSGRMGCGCAAYGHVSPTRLYLGKVTDTVVDIAPLFGTFTAVYVEESKKSSKK